jgi:RNA polymerase sigma factor for flagellar operon FliA
VPDRQKLVANHIELVKIIASAIRNNLPPHVELDDLVQAGALGLIDAARKYDSRKGVEFKTYAKYRIRGAILDGLRQVDTASRDARKRQKQIEQVTRELAYELGRSPNDDEIAVAMGISVGRLRQSRMHINAVSTAQEGAVAGRPVNREPTVDPSQQPDSVCARERRRELLDAAMQSLPERSRAIIHLYYRSELTMREIGNRFGVNESRISQIHKRALETMAGALRAIGVHSRAAC